jgi:hypothetical protein
MLCNQSSGVKSVITAGYVSACVYGGAGALSRRVNAIVGKERNTVADESTELNYIIPL